VEARKHYGVEEEGLTVAENPKGAVA